MNGNTLKLMYEKIPTGVKGALAPLFVRAMLDNHEYRRTWMELDAFDAMGAEERRITQEVKLRETLAYAYRYVPYYKALFDEAGIDPDGTESTVALASLPLLEKSDVVAAGDALYSTEAGLSYYETFTGGSSGHALKVLLDSASVYRERAFACHAYAKYGYDPRRSRMAAFFGHNKPGGYYYSPLKNEIVISPFRLYREGSATGVAADIRRFGAVFLSGYPSAIFQLAQMAEREGIEISVKHVFYYAENYELDKRDFVNSVFGCTSSSDYGHTEHAVKAEVGDNFVRFNGLYGYTELVPTENPSEFRIVATGFTSRKMPLIRYATDDVVEVAPDGTHQLVGHKRSEVFLTAKGGAHVFKGAMTLHVPELGKIRGYQYRQRVPGEATLCLVSLEPLTKEEEDRILLYLRTRTEGVLDVHIEYVRELKTTIRGKALWAVVENPRETGDSR